MMRRFGQGLMATFFLLGILMTHLDAHAQAVPQINSVDHASMPVGGRQCVNGVGFGDSQGTSIITLNGTAMNVFPWVDYQICFTVPAGSTVGTAAVQVTTAAGSSNVVNFTLTPPPAISSISPASGTVGTQVILTGTNFGGTQGSGTVSIGPAASIINWSDTQIVFTVPQGAPIGQQTVWLFVDSAFTTSNFTVIGPPQISSVDHASMPVGGRQCVNGAGFGDSQGSSTITLNGSALSAFPWVDYQICFTVPATTTVGTASVQVTTAAGSSNAVTFTLTPPPAISGISPSSGTVGTQVTLTGTNFGATQGSSTVSIGPAATVTSWSDTQIVFTVPQAAYLGQQTVWLFVDSTFATTNFTVGSQIASISSLSPTSGSPGRIVTIAGSNFGPDQGTVTFSGQSATIFRWSDTAIAAGIPLTATTGNVIVNAGGTASNGVTFVVAPTINTLSASGGVPGTHVTMAGSNFGSSQGTGSVQIGNVSAEVVNWADSSIEFAVPSQAATGNVIVTSDNALLSNPATFVVDSSGPLLQLSISDTPVQVNLTSAQVLDWIHWGRIAAAVSDRKALDTPLISDFIPVNDAQVAPFFSNIGFSWSDGNYLPVASETSTDVETFSSGGGFQITVPADTTAKTLNLYTEVFFGQAVLHVSLSDGSAVAITDQSVIDSDVGNKIYSINFRAASAGQTLTVTLTATNSSGGIGLQAATLTQALPFVSITAPASDPAFLASSSIPLAATSRQIDNAALSLQVNGSNGSSFNGTAPPFNFAWGPLSAGHYTASATASDTFGLSNSSSLAEIDVIGQGGSLSLQKGDVPPTSFGSPLDLNAQGTADWVLWGPFDNGDQTIDHPDFVLARKAEVKPLISDYKLMGNHRVSSTVFANNILFLDGSQLFFGGSDLLVHGHNSGFEVTVAADSTPRTLQLYVAANSARGRVTAFMSDGSAPVVADNSFDFPSAADGNGYSGTALYTINYSAASAGQILTVRYTLDFDYGQGAVALIGATLSGDSVNPSAPVPQIDSIDPSSSPVSTPVTITGTNFGATQGSGEVTFNQIDAQIVNWSDSSITVYVPGAFADGNVAQVVVVTANGTSNEVSFRIPAYQFFPPALSLVVGQVATVTPKDANKQPVTGLSWSSTNPGVVSVSVEGIITGVSPGSATVYGGDTPLPVTVYSGSSLPPGTVLWSVPSNPGATFIASLVPAVPSDSGVDVFTYDDTGYVSAISADGEPVWRQYVGAPAVETTLVGSQVAVNSLTRIVPDFVGNALLHSLNIGNNDQDGCHSTQKITSVGPTGVQDLYVFSEKVTPLFSCQTPDGYMGVLNVNAAQGGGIQTEVPHPSGVVFVQDIDTIVVIDPATQTQRANITLEKSTSNFVPSSSTASLSPLIVAGDGNAYMAYSYVDTVFSSPGVNVEHEHRTVHTNVLRVAPDGSFAKINLSTWTDDQTDDSDPAIPGVDPSAVVINQVVHTTYSRSGTGLGSGPSITNADIGVAVAAPVIPISCADAYVGTYFTKGTGDDLVPHTINQLTGCPDLNHQHTQISFVAHDAVASQVDVPLQSFTPSLQREDGSYIGISFDTLAAVGLDGTPLWSLKINPDANGTGTKVQPLYATGDSGAIATSTSTGADNYGNVQLGMIYSIDQNGSPQGQEPDMGQRMSWKGNWYTNTLTTATVSLLARPPLLAALSSGAFSGGNPSHTDAYFRPWYFILSWQNDFTFLPSYPTALNLPTDITASATVIKDSALNTLKTVYKAFPLIIAEGTAGTGDDWATVVNTQNIANSPSCGATNPNAISGDGRVHGSQVDYRMNMFNAQDALKVTIHNSQDEAKAVKRADVLQAIGRGIGVTAGHEIAHHFLFSCCAMDADPATDPLARGAYNATGCSASSDPSPWIGFWPNPVINLHWEAPTLRGLNECLSSGWRNFGSSACHK